MKIGSHKIFKEQSVIKAKTSYFYITFFYNPQTYCFKVLL